MITIIDSDRYSDSGIETLLFPGGEPHVKVPSTLTGQVFLFLKLRTWVEVGYAACLIDALSRNTRIDGELNAFIPYFPGARQDRSDGSAPFTLMIVNDLFALLGLMSVFDLHSNVLSDALPHGILRNLMPANLQVPIRDDVVGIIAPDAGAAERAEQFRARFYASADLIQCSKHRDPVTGRLFGYHMPKLSRQGAYIIVDDICDGGGTFNLLAEAFGKDPVGEHSRLEMFVSHGIFSKGIRLIDPRIEHIMTTDSWCTVPPGDHGRLEVLPLAPLLPLILGESNA